MNVDPPRAAAQSTYKGQPYYFCCTGCKKQFDAAPEKFVTA
jgi:YHS domain-containing protein